MKQSEGKKGMTSKASPLLLDCTLRDGGYVNNWEFDFATALQVRDALYAAGIRYIELGIMGHSGIAGKQTKFSTFSGITPLLQNRQGDCHYCVMLTQSEWASGGFNLLPHGKDTVDLIRLAFFKAERDAAIDTARKLKGKGYLVFLQAMATSMYSPDELAELLEKVNRLHPDAFYMVDSFSTMYNDDVLKMKTAVLEKLDTNIMLGFHAHNNIQMAYSNAIAFMENPTDRPLIVDGSIYGMGRGAGNAPIELLMKYINEKINGAYQIQPVLSAFETCIAPIFKEQYWGYSMPYFLTACKDVNPAYGWYLEQKGITSLADINIVLDHIPEESKYTLVKSTAERAISEYMKERANE